PLHKSTQQVENLRPDTACGLQAEKTGRFSLHRRDNTRPDKRSASGIFSFGEKKTRRAGLEISRKE
ncbi:hypothetical protein, partial [Escherichia coli]|uniref:hypothetical protein n=1 Tax=Escherichia coli TaxID=562 RepID=UPI001FCEECBC